MTNWNGRNERMILEVLTLQLELPEADAAKAVSRAKGKPGSWIPVRGGEVRKDGNSWSARTR